MRFLVRLKAIGVPADTLVAAVRTIAGTLGADPRNPKWTSYGALELDVFSRNKLDFTLFLTAVEPLAQVEFTRDLNVARPYIPEAALYSEARELFNAERYWECHEVLEGVWRTKQGEEKKLLQGVILVCAAFVHHQKKEGNVAMGVLLRSQPLLQSARAQVAGIDLLRLRRDVQAIADGGTFRNFRV